MVKNEPVLVVKGKGIKALIVTDLHIGFEKALAEKGIRLPSQTPSLLERLERILKREKVKELYLLGDIKHSTSKILLHEWMDIPWFFERLLSLAKVSVLLGNHDGGIEALLPRGVKLLPTSGFIIAKDILLTHGHSWLEPNAFSCKTVIMGHHHFTFDIREVSGLSFSQQAWLVAKLSKEKVAKNYLRYLGRIVKERVISKFEGEFKVKVRLSKAIVMPAFNPMLKGRPINRQVSDDRFQSPLLKGAVIESESDVFLLDGTYLGRLSDLKA
jgi:hypothetical protein